MYAVAVTEVSPTALSTASAAAVNVAGVVPLKVTTPLALMVAVVPATADHEAAPLIAREFDPSYHSSSVVEKPEIVSGAETNESRSLKR